METRGWKRKGKDVIELLEQEEGNEKVAGNEEAITESQQLKPNLVSPTGIKWRYFL